MKGIAHNGTSLNTPDLAARRRTNERIARRLLVSLVKVFPGDPMAPAYVAAVRHLGQPARIDRGNPYGATASALRGLVAAWAAGRRVVALVRAESHARSACRSCGDAARSLCRPCRAAFKTTAAQERAA